MYSKPSAAFVIITSILLSILAINPIYAGVVWSDEFDGPSIDQSKWTYDTGNWGFGNGELQYYTGRPENAYIENGSLVIKAMREYYKGDTGKSFTSARLKTQGRFAFKYGTIEARIKVPDLANGLWPAFWLLGNNIGANEWPRCGELDILEMGMHQAIEAGLQNKKHSAYAHWYDNGNKNYGTFIDSPVNLNEDYHLYKLSWTPTTIKAYIDGVEYWVMDITPSAAPALDEFHKPFFIIANLAVGGWNFVEIQDPGAITAPFPAKMYIDWIRVSSNADTVLYYNEDNMETGNFGVYTETTPVQNHINYDTDANLYIWHNMNATTTTPYEGAEAWSFDFGGGDWFGMGVLCSPDRNMKNYSDGYLHFNMKTTSTTDMKVGIKSSAAGESWLPLIKDGEFGPARDGNWHEVVFLLTDLQISISVL
jgi:beta-glucanase (GH16 family)